MGGGVRLKAMIDRLSANQEAPFGAAEHLEFFGAGDDLRSARMASCKEGERDGRKPARMKGLSIQSVFNYTEK